MKTLKSIYHKKRKSTFLRISVSKVDVLIFTSILVTFPLSGFFAVIPPLSYLNVVSVLLLLCVYLASIIRQRVPVKIYLPLLIYAYLLFDTLIHSGDIMQAVASLIRDASCFYLVVYWVLKGGKTELIFNSSRAFDLLLAINAIHMLLTKDGFGFTRFNNHIFVLTSDNGLAFYIIAFVIVHELRNRILPYGFIRNLLYYLVIIYELIRGESATSYFVFMVLFLGILLAKKVAVNKLYYVGCGIVGFLNLLLLYIRQFSFMEPIFKAMGKSATISGRVRIWDGAIDLINKSFVFGYGASDNMYYVYYNNMEVESHNMLLSYMLQGGIILLILMISLILLCGWKIRRSKSILSRYVTVGLMAYLITFLVEAPAFACGFYFMMALCLMEGTRFGEKKSEIA